MVIWHQLVARRQRKGAGMADKTKATLQGRPSNTNKSTIDTTRPCAGGQSLSAPEITGTGATILKLLATFRRLVEPTILKRVANLQLGLGCAENFGHLIVGYAPLQHTPITTHILGRLVCLTGYAQFWAHLDSGHCSLLGCTPLPYTPDDSRNFSRCSDVSNGQLNFEPTDLIQPFGSIPRACSSLRRVRFIQVARDVSPSCFATSSSCARKSSGKRIWYCGDLFSCCVDMVVTGAYYHLHGNDHCNYSCHTKQRPEVFAALTRRLTKPLIGVTVMADQQHTQTHQEFTWRFLALSALGRNVIHITATTEREARELSPAGYVMVFAGRLPVQEMRHA